jgi:hypothetical protein
VASRWLPFRRPLEVSARGKGPAEGILDPHSSVSNGKRGYLRRYSDRRKQKTTHRLDNADVKDYTSCRRPHLPQTLPHGGVTNEAQWHPHTEKFFHVSFCHKYINIVESDRLRTCGQLNWTMIYPYPNWLHKRVNKFEPACACALQFNFEQPMPCKLAAVQYTNTDGSYLLHHPYSFGATDSRHTVSFLVTKMIPLLRSARMYDVSKSRTCLSTANYRNLFATYCIMCLPSTTTWRLVTFHCSKWQVCPLFYRCLNRF